MADQRPPNEQDDRRRLFRDVWGSAPDESSLPERTDAVDMPPLIDRSQSENARLDQVERSLREARSEIEDLRISLREMTATIERIARRLQLAGFSETT